MNRFTRLALLLLTLGPASAGAQEAPPQEAHPQVAPGPGTEGLVNWMTLEEAQAAMKKVPRPMLIDFYTDWCGWCKRMMQTTYSSPQLAEYINTWFYPVKFNAETRDSVYYRDTLYLNHSEGMRPPHDFAIKILGQRQTYPSTVFVTPDYNYVLNTSGYLDALTIEPLLVYVVEGGYRSTVYDDFKTAFIRTFRDTTHREEPASFVTLDQALFLQRKKPKKILVSLGTSWCNTCRMMTQSTLADDRLQAYLNEKYYVVALDAQALDTVEIDGVKYGGIESREFPFNPVVKYLTGGNFAFPMTLILDEHHQRLDGIPYFLSVASLEPVLHYFGENEHQKMKWEEFMEGWKKGAYGPGKP